MTHYIKNIAQDNKHMAQDIRIYMRGLIQACREHAYLRLNQDYCEHAYLWMIQACWEHAYLLTWAQIGSSVNRLAVILDHP